MDPALILILAKDHCIFCLNNKTLNTVTGSPCLEEVRNVDGYELLRKYFGIKTAEYLNDIFDALAFTNELLLNSEFPAPLLCPNCITIFYQLDQLNSKLASLEVEILERIRQLRKVIFDNSVRGGKQLAISRTEFEKDILESSGSQSQEAVIGILNNFQNVFHEETEGPVQIQLESLNQAHTYPDSPNPDNLVDEVDLIAGKEEGNSVDGLDPVPTPTAPDSFSGRESESENIVTVITTEVPNQSQESRKTDGTGGSIQTRSKSAKRNVLSRDSSVSSNNFDKLDLEEYEDEDDKPKYRAKTRKKSPRKGKALARRKETDCSSESENKRDGKQIVEKPKRQGFWPLKHKCSKCPSRYTTPKSLRRHMLQVHQEELPRTVNTRTYRCNVCGYSKPGSRLQGFAQHLETHETDEKSFECDDCLYKFTNQQFYQLHDCPQVGKLPGTATVTGIATERILTSKKKENWLCRFCEQEFTSEKRIQAHTISEHPGSQPIPCEICAGQQLEDIAFKSKNDLITHMIAAHGAVPYKCRLCGDGLKAFSKWYDMFTHMNTSHLGGCYTCPDCSRNFVDNYKYQEHLLTHQEDRKFVCDKCGATLKSKNSLRYHKTTHNTSIEKSVCEYCCKEFKTRSNLGHHINYVHLKKRRKSSSNESKQIKKELE